jgi:hypothetical protein
MLLAIRRVLTVDQWKKLRELPGVDAFHPRPEFRPPAPPVPPAPPAPPAAAAPPPAE